MVSVEKQVIVAVLVIALGVFHLRYTTYLRAVFLKNV